MVDGQDEDDDGQNRLSREVDAEKGRVLEERAVESQLTRQQHEDHEDGEDDLSQEEVATGDRQLHGITAQSHDQEEAGHGVHQIRVPEHDDWVPGGEFVGSSPPE